MTPELDALAQALARLGCPPEKSGDMAQQLDKRARQLAEAKGRSYEQALTHLLGLMRQGWAAPQPATPPPAALIPSPLSPAMIRPWPTLGTRPLGDFRIFTLRGDRRVSPRNGFEQEFIVLEARPWVNVVAVTPERQVVMVEQFRHGSETVELEIPGGVLDPGETDPVAAGLRELREETGYTGRDARLIGTVFANPAIQDNQCHTVLVEDCRCTDPLKLDQSEDLVTRLVPVADLPRLVAEGGIRHSLVVVALYHFELCQRSRA
jgi:ADP-ribose pyrophosphatase